MTTNSGEFQLLTIGTSELPRQWIEYTCFDVVTLELNVLRSLTQSDPEAFQALQRWVNSGGQLWVSNVGQNFEGLAELSKLLRLRTAIARLADEEIAKGLTVVDD